MIYLNVLFFILKFISSEIVIPFTTIKENITSAIPSTFMSFYSQNKIVSIFKIGTPYQEISFRIKTLRKPLSINSVQMGTYNIKRFNESVSTSFIPLSNNPTYHGENDFTQGVLAKEIFNIHTNNDELIIKNLSFFLGVSDYSYSRESGVLGLSLAEFDWRTNGVGFIQQLKKKNITKKYNFFIKYNEENDNDDGLLVLDGLPHEIYPKKYDKNKYNDFYAEIVSNSSMGLLINEAYHGETLVDCEFKVELAVEDNFIKGTQIFKEILMQNFFKEKIIRKICQESVFTFSNSKNLEFFYCNKKLNLSEFKNISLSVMNSELKIEFNYNDLFYEYNDNYYFLMYFPKEFYSNTYLKLGKMLFKKYVLTFDHDTRRIGFYKNDNKDQNSNKEEGENDDNKNNIKEKKKFLGILPWIIIGVLVIIILFLGFYIIYYKPCKYRTKRANELQDDNYTYEGINNNE